MGDKVTFEEASAAAGEVADLYESAEWLTYVAVEPDASAGFRVQVGAAPDVTLPAALRAIAKASAVLRHIGNVPVYIRLQDRASALGA